MAPAPDLAHRYEPARTKLPPSPIVAKSADQLGKGYTPPQAHAAPPLDTLVQPRPRVNRSPEQPRQHTTLRVPFDTPQPKSQPKLDRPTPQPRDNKPAGPPAAGPKRDEHKGKGNGNG